MQYIDGQSLAERIRKSPLPPGDVVDIGIQAAQALEAAHAAGIIHRDIKPQNIIITPRGQLRCWTSDSRSSLSTVFLKVQMPRRWERLTEAGGIVGTPGFMSPEQLYGKAIDARSDIFSLGVTLYECATGISAFERGTLIEVSLRVVTETPLPPSDSTPRFRLVSTGSLRARWPRILPRATSPLIRSESDLLELKRILDGPASGLAPDLHGRSSTPRDAKPRSSRFKALIAAAVVATLLAAWFASALLRRGRHVPPPEAVAWYDRGTSAIREGAYFQASKALERALEIDSSFALARARWAEAYAEIELTDRAREELLQAMALLRIVRHCPTPSPRIWTLSRRR